MGKRGGRRTLVGAGLGAAAAGVLLTSVFHTLVCGIIAVLFGAWFVWEHRRNATALKFFFARAAVGVLLAAPVVIVFAQHWAQSPPPVSFGWQIQARNSTEPWQWLLHPRLRTAIAHVEENDFVGESRVRFWYLPGYVLTAFLLVCGVKLRGLREEPGHRSVLLFLSVCGVVFMLLSFGPYLKIGPPTDPNPPATVIPMPAKLLKVIPGLGTLRSLWHFGFVGTMCFAIAGGCAAARCLSRWPEDRRRVLHLALPVVVLAEVFAGSILSAPVTMDAQARLLAEHTPAGHAVFPMPQAIYEARGHFMYQQTIHSRPLIGGYLSRDPAAFEEWKKARRWPVELEEVMFGQRPQLTPTAEQNLREDVDTLRIGALVIFGPGLARRAEEEWRRLGFDWQFEATSDGWTAIRRSSTPDGGP